MRSLRIATLSVLLLASPATPRLALGSPAAGLSRADLGKLVEALRAEPERALKVRLQAALILGRTGGEPAVPPLLECLDEDPDYPVRAACAMALGNLGAVRAVESLVGHLDEREALVREECRRALLKLARPEALPYLQAARERGSARVRLELAQVVSAVPGEAAGGLLCELLGDPAGEVRQQAESSLAAMKPQAASAAVLRGLDHPNYRVKAACARLSGLRGQTEAIDRLAELAAAPLEALEVQSAARGALRELRAGLKVAELAAEARDPRLDKPRRSRALLLLSLAGGDEALAACVEALGAADESIRAAAAQALAELGDGRALAPLRLAGARQENARLAKVIAHAVGRLERGAR